MKAILEFELPKESHEYKCAVEGTKYMDALWVILRHLKQEMDSNKSDVYLQSVDEINSKIVEILNDLNIDVYEN